MDKQVNTTILLVNDNPFVTEEITAAIADSNYHLDHAQNEKQAFELMSNNQPDLIVSNAKLSDATGHELCENIKRNAGYIDVPFIIYDLNSTVEDIVRGFKSGCIDYISNPITSEELRGRVNAHLKIKRKIDKLKQSISSLQQVNSEIRVKNIKLEQIMNKFRVASTTDYLTGIYNKRYALETFKKHIADDKHNLGPFSVIIADIDSFKSINDTYGHVCGDYILKSVVNTLRSSLREGDLFCRWGGEEFLFLLPYATVQNAQVFAERMRQLIKQTSFCCDYSEISVTITLGIAEYSHELGIEGTIKKADEALYEGKRNGKNQVKVAK